VRAKGGKAMVRGLRGVGLRLRISAGRHEQQARARGGACSHPQRRYQFVSSTLVREIALLGGDVAQFTSPHVWQRLMERKESGQKP
jgi:pantetheine-phosphate adenylyltransferase